MPKFVPTLIPQGDNESVRRQVAQQLNKVKQQIAHSDYRTNPMNMGGNRITDVAEPSNPTDAVNLRYLKKKLDDITQQHISRRPLGKLYSVVFSYNGAVVAGSVSPPYTINKGQTGSPTLVSIAVTGTGTAAANFNIARNGTNVLTSDIILPSGSTGPVVVTNFVPGTSFKIGDLLTPVVDVASGVSYADLQIQVQPSGN